MNMSWPISTPTLNVNNARGMSPMRQSDFGQCAGETEAVQQAERERDHPGPSCGEAGLARAVARDFAGEQKNGERNGGLHRWTWHMNNP